MPNWSHVLREIKKEKNDPGGDSASDKIRKKYLMQLHAHHGRNIICYYSGWLSKSPKIEGLAIGDDDKNGFMLCIHKLDRSKGLDLFLHTPGGSGAATESLVNYLRQMFGNDIRAFVPQLAMSAGTIIACACKEIFMGKHSNLGPVDPLVNGIQAYAVLAGIETAYKEIVADRNKVLIWNPMLSRYNPAFVQHCHWSIEKSRELVVRYLKENMFLDLEEDERVARANKIVEYLTSLSSSKGHDHHIHLQECIDMGLKIQSLENPEDKMLQDLVLTVHHCFMYALSNTGAFKIIENQVGHRYVKTLVTQVFMQGPQAPSGSIVPSAVPAAPSSPAN